MTTTDAKPILTEGATLEHFEAAVRDAVTTALLAVIPDRYTPELAAQIAEDAIGQLKALRTPTASPEPLLTPAQFTLVLDEGLGAHIAAPVETGLRDIDDNYSAAENERVPFLAAKAVVTDYRSQAYGRRTEVWLDYGRITASLTPGKAREVLAAMTGFCVQLEAVIELAEREAAKDFEGDPEIAAADREAEDRRISAVTAGRA